jgi:plastocyanin
MIYREHVQGFESLLRMATVVILSLSFTGCGNKQSSTESGEYEPVAHSGVENVDAATAGSVMGKILFNGVLPRMRTIDMIDVPNCAKMHATPVSTGNILLGDNGALQNVVVYLQGDFSAYSFPQTEMPVKVNQEGCIYDPHVVAVMTGDPLEVTNVDSVTHNINAMSRLRQGWNETQLPGGTPIVRRFAREEIPMPVKCNMHPWMRFYVAVLNHPYFQVTGKDGQFALRNVPPGEYTLMAWHELYGTKKQTIVIQPNQEQTVAITYTDKDHS